MPVNPTGHFDQGHERNECPRGEIAFGNPEGISPFRSHSSASACPERSRRVEMTERGPRAARPRPEPI